MIDRDAAIERMLHEGIPKLHIARRLGLSRDTVDRVAARVGFPSRRRGQATQDWEKVRAYYEAGSTGAECQRHFGFSPATWDAAIKRGDIVPRTRGASRLPPGQRRRQVATLLDEGRGVAEVAEVLGVSKPTVCYHARKLGIPPKGRFARRFDWDEISRVYESGVSMRECKRRFGFSQDSWHEAVKRGDVVPRAHVIPLEELLVKGRRTSRGHLKTRLINAGLKEDRCERCGLDEWLGAPLSAQLHHCNGDGTDNRLSNLRFLCPNCHAQTANWGGRNVRRRKERALKLAA